MFSRYPIAIVLNFQLAVIFLIFFPNVCSLSTEPPMDSSELPSSAGNRVVHAKSLDHPGEVSSSFEELTSSKKEEENLSEHDSSSSSFSSSPSSLTLKSEKVKKLDLEGLLRALRKIEKPKSTPNQPEYGSQVSQPIASAELLRNLFKELGSNMKMEISVDPPPRDQHDFQSPQSSPSSRGKSDSALSELTSSQKTTAVTSVSANPSYNSTSLSRWPFQETFINRTFYKELTREMFNFAYGNYLSHAFPLDELDPIHCTGRGVDPNRDNINVNDALGNFSLALIDSLDTIALLGNRTQFWDAVHRVVESVSFDQDSLVQVFEVNIRVLGGLLSSHLLATDPSFDMQAEKYGYAGELLSLAYDLGLRLLPAFEGAPFGIPYPRVNLRYGVPLDTRLSTCTAGAGSLLLEFGALSRLTGDPIFEDVARRTVLAIWDKRDRNTGLLGSTISLATGEWENTMSGIGAGLDSFFEYLVKGHILLGEPEYLSIFEEAYQAINSFVRHISPPLFLNVDMHGRGVANSWIDSLQAYFPALQVLVGDVAAARHLHLFYWELWQRFHAFPERFDWFHSAPSFSIYPLRPEFVESTYFLYRATKDPFYLHIGASILNDIQTHMKVQCGYATLHDVVTKEKEDRMESFFLSETLKYLFLLFDEANVIHKMDDVVFTTQAHILRSSKIRFPSPHIMLNTSVFESAVRRPNHSYHNEEDTCPIASQHLEFNREYERAKMMSKSEQGSPSEASVLSNEDLASPPRTCSHVPWFDQVLDPFNPDFVQAIKKIVSKP